MQVRADRFRPARRFAPTYVCPPERPEGIRERDHHLKINPRFKVHNTTHFLKKKLKPASAMTAPSSKYYTIHHNVQPKRPQEDKPQDIREQQQPQQRQADSDTARGDETPPDFPSRRKTPDVQTVLAKYLGVARAEDHSQRLAEQQKRRAVAALKKDPEARWLKQKGQRLHRASRKERKEAKQLFDVLSRDYVRGMQSKHGPLWHLQQQQQQQQQPQSARVTVSHARRNRAAQEAHLLPTVRYLRDALRRLRLPASFMHGLKSLPDDMHVRFEVFVDKLFMPSTFKVLHNKPSAPSHNPPVRAAMSTARTRHKTIEEEPAPPSALPGDNDLQQPQQQQQVTERGPYRPYHFKEPFLSSDSMDDLLEENKDRPAAAPSEEYEQSQQRHYMFRPVQQQQQFSGAAATTTASNASSRAASTQPVGGAASSTSSSPWPVPPAPPVHRRARPRSSATPLIPSRLWLPALHRELLMECLAPDAFGEPSSSSSAATSSRTNFDLFNELADSKNLFFPGENGVWQVSQEVVPSGKEARQYQALLTKAGRQRRALRKYNEFKQEKAATARKRVDTNLRKHGRLVVKDFTFTDGITHTFGDPASPRKLSQAAAVRPAVIKVSSPTKAVSLKVSHGNASLNLGVELSGKEDSVERILALMLGRHLFTSKNDGLYNTWKETLAFVQSMRGKGEIRTD